MDEAGANIEYGYCFAAPGGTAVDVLKVDGDEGIEGLSDAGFKLVARRDL